MFSNNLKRSVATLGVVAGLLAAAVPAIAQGGRADPTRGPQDLGFRFEMGGLPCARAVDGGNDTVRATVTCLDQDMSTVKAPSKATDPSAAGASFTLDVASSEVFELNTFGLTEHEGAAFRGEVTGLEPNALGTQVGSEGVKAPTSTADDQMKYYLEQAWPVTGAAGSGANNLRGEAIDIIP